MTYTPLRRIVAHKQLDDLPAGIAQCRRCSVLIGDRVAAGEEYPELCCWCEDEVTVEEAVAEARGTFHNGTDERSDQR